MIKWNKDKDRVLYREDKEGNRTYPFQEDNPASQKEKKPEPTKKELQGYCDEQGIEYKPSDTKATLINLLQGD